MPRPPRTSCDRCHSQKLRCPKQPGSPVCTRCAKAGSSCVFSPAGAGGMRRPAATSDREDAVLFSTDPEVPDIDLDWSSFDLYEPLTALAPAEAQPSLASDARAVCVQRLSSLALDIDQAVNLIPTDPGIHIPIQGPTPDLSAHWSAKYSQRQCLEQLFSSAQRLLDVYPSAMNIIFRRPASEACHNPDCLHRQQLPNELEARLGPHGAKTYAPRPIDSFTFNLLLNCHTRLVDILEVLLVHVAACAKVALATPALGEPPLHIPELKVGNFVASPQASSSMQAVLLVYMASALADRAKELASKLAEALDDNDSTKQSDIWKLQCAILVEENDSKVVALHAIRDMLVKVGYMR